MVCPFILPFLVNDGVGVSAVVFGHAATVLYGVGLSVSRGLESV